MAKFFCLPNLATDRVTVSESPWDFKVPDDVLALGKKDYQKRWFNPETRHCLYHLAEGQNPDYAVSAGNQVAALHGFTADYDGILTPDLVESLKRKPQSKYLPAYWCESHSGRLHLVWLFERPVTVAGNAHAAALVKIVALKLKAAKWGVGYDPTSEEPVRVMDIGRAWHPFSEESRVPASELVMWDFALFEKSARSLVDDVVDIDIETVAAEVRRRKWPHDPPRNFTVGARCVRFWAADADNQTGAQIAKDGIRVYTPHDNGFKSWWSLLGAEFCEAFTAHSMAPFVEDTTYCHTKDEYWRFFRNDASPHYEKRTEKVLRRDLVTEARLSPKAAKGEDLSPVDSMLYTITRKNAVDAVAPILYRPSGRIFVDGLGTVLNTSMVVAAKPVPRLVSVSPDDLSKFPDARPEYRENPTLCAWDNPFATERFPHIHGLLTSYFCESQAEYDRWIAAGRPSGFAPLHDAQLVRLISWMSHFYTGAARMLAHPGRGQALIIAGPIGVGKSFFADHLLRKLMGGATSGAEYYLGGCRFTSSIASVPVHWIDDKLGSRSQRERLRFTEALKVTVANASMRYEAKFGSSVESIPWPGRIVVLANEDAQSLSVLPDLDMSTRDKFMMLKFGHVKFHWESDADNEKWLSDEIPWFAKFLLGWRIPAAIRDVRFGVAAMQHKDMAQASAENGLTQVTLEVLETCIESVAGSADGQDAGDRDGWAIEGNAVKIFKWIQSVDPALGREVVDSRTLQQTLSTLHRNGAYNITLDESTKRWRIPYKIRKVTA